MSLPILAYIDPTGGLPPPLWGGLLAGILAAVAAAAAALKIWWRRIFSFAARRPRTAGLVGLMLLAAVAAAGFVIAGDGMGWSFTRKAVTKAAVAPRSAPPEARGPRVLVLAFDGLDPQLVNRYMAEGRLPNFARLAKDGLYHPLATSMAPQSPVAWSTFITGTDPGGHGVFDFINRDPATYRLDLSLANRRTMALPWRGTPLWQRPAVARFGLTAQRLPMVFPPPQMNGRILAGMGVWDLRGTEGTYIVFSTSHERPPRSRGLRYPLERDGAAFRGEMPGPLEIGRPEQAVAHFALVLGGAGGTLHVQSGKVPLIEGRWSDWVEVSFAAGPLKLRRVPAITRVLLRRQGEDVTLYVSPLQFDPRRPLYSISYPPGYAAELVDEVGLYATRGMPMDTQAASDGALTDDELIEQAREITAESKRMLDFELGRFESGVLFAYFEAPDILQHFFWRAIDPEHPLHATSQNYKEVIPRMYADCDAILGQSQKLLGERGQVVVISDHGFAPFRRSVHLNAILAELGFLATTGAASADPASRDAELLARVDWRKTKAYAAGFNSVYLNLVGREGQGIVTAADYEATTRAVAKALERWTDPDTGTRPMSAVYLARQLYSRHDSEHMPDLIVGYARGYRASWETVLGGVPETTVQPNTQKWSGDHCIDAALVPGIFLSSDRGLDAKSLAEVGAAIDGFLAAHSASLPKRAP